MLEMNRYESIWIIKLIPYEVEQMLKPEYKYLKAPKTCIVNLVTN